MWCWFSFLLHDVIGFFLLRFWWTNLKIIILNLLCILNNIVKVYKFICLKVYQIRFVQFKEVWVACGLWGLIVITVMGIIGILWGEGDYQTYNGKLEIKYFIFTLYLRTMYTITFDRNVSYRLTAANPLSFTHVKKILWLKIPFTDKGLWDKQVAAE